MTQSLPDNIALTCESCGYQLEGLSKFRCPECGQAYNPAELKARFKSTKVRPGIVLAKFSVVPVIALSLLALAMINPLSGMEGIIAVVIIVLVGVIACVFASIPAAVKLARYAANPSTSGIGFHASDSLTFAIWLVLFIGSGGSIILGFVVLDFFY